ncbi:MAG: hypothetical protein GX061_02210, partial [Eubacteriaceae bacterium]|nr:hypothetical protein [Eubacteriaceae bacterium]
MRIVFVLQIALLVLNIALSFIQTGSLFPRQSVISFVENTLLLLAFNIGLLWYTMRMGIKIPAGENFGEGYTRIMIPSFIFIIFADIFLTVSSLLEGGIFRDRLSKK